MKRLIVVLSNGEIWEQIEDCKIYIVDDEEWKQLSVEYLYPRWVLRHRAGLHLRVLYALFLFISKGQPKLWAFFKTKYGRGDLKIKLD